METTEKQKKVFSAIQPTGTPHIGNYVGALKNWVAMQDEFDCLYAIADLHSITVEIEAASLRKNVYEMAALLLAMGIREGALFVQSQVPAHAELTWILNCHTYVGEAKRMTQFKDKSAKHAQNVNMGLFDYPVLMAADILLYQADFVPVGQDQKQHLELSRNLAERFNNKFSPTFKVPEPYIPKVGARIMSLSDPDAKMSKSDTNENSYILALDDADTVVRKFKRAVTDSNNVIKYSPEAKGVSNLLSIYSVFSGKTIPALEAEYEGKGYGDFKRDAGECVAEALRPLREEYKRISADKAYVAEALEKGRARADYEARKTLSKVYKKVGLR